MPFFVAFFPHCIEQGHGRKRILVGDEGKNILLEIVSEAGKRLNILLSTYA